MNRLAVLAVATLLAVSLTGCSEDDSGPNLTVEGTVSLCPATGQCAELPAAGAKVHVLDAAGEVVDEGALADDGRLDFTVPAGTYTATLSMPGLDIRTTNARSPQVNVVGDGDVGVLAITFPPVGVVG